MQTRLLVTLLLAALVLTKGTMVGYTSALDVLPYLSKSGEFFKDPLFLGGLVSLMGILVIAMHVLEIGFYLLAPACVTLLLFWLAVVLLKQRLSFGQPIACSAILGVFSIFTLLGLLAFGVDEGGMERGTGGQTSFSIASALCTGYLMCKLLGRARPKAGDANAA